MSNIPHRLKEARVAAGLTQAQLARKMGAGRVSISRWETGKDHPSTHVIASWGYATGFNPGWITTGEGPKHSDGVAESYQGLPSKEDMEALAEITAALHAALGRKLPSKVFGALCVEAFLESKRNPDLRGDALIERLQPLIRMALAGAN